MLLPGATNLTLNLPAYLEGREGYYNYTIVNSLNPIQAPLKSKESVELVESALPAFVPIARDAGYDRLGSVFDEAANDSGIARFFPKWLNTADEPVSFSECECDFRDVPFLLEGGYFNLVSRDVQTDLRFVIRGESTEEARMVAVYLPMTAAALLSGRDYRGLPVVGDRLEGSASVMNAARPVAVGEIVLELRDGSLVGALLNARLGERFSGVRGDSSIFEIYRSENLPTNYILRAGINIRNDWLGEWRGVGRYVSAHSADPSIVQEVFSQDRVKGGAPGRDVIDVQRLEIPEPYQSDVVAIRVRPARVWTVIDNGLTGLRVYPGIRVHGVTVQLEE